MKSVSCFKSCIDVCPKKLFIYCCRPIGAMIENMMSSMQVTPQGGQQLFPSQPTPLPQSNPRPSVPASQSTQVASVKTQQDEDLTKHILYKDLQVQCSSHI